jgi:hypothetical protein
VIDSVQVGESVIYQEVQDELVLLDMTNQKYYGLDSVGADMWRALMEHGNIDEAARVLKAMYSVEDETLRRDLRVLVSDLQEKGLLVATTAGAV